MMAQKTSWTSHKCLNLDQSSAQVSILSILDLFGCLETVILSSQLQQKSYIFFTKSKFIFLTETRIIQASF